MHMHVTMQDILAIMTELKNVVIMLNYIMYTSSLSLSL